MNASAEELTGKLGRGRYESTKKRGWYLNFITVLINEYEMLAEESAYEAERARRFREVELSPRKDLVIDFEYARAVRISRQKELSYRRDSIRFRREADRLKEGTTCRMCSIESNALRGAGDS